MVQNPKYLLFLQGFMNWYFAKVKTKHQSHIYYEGARPVSSLIAFTKKDQTIFNGLLKPRFEIALWPYDLKIRENCPTYRRYSNTKFGCYQVSDQKILIGQHTGIRTMV